MSVKVSADLSGVEGFIGGVQGILTAIANPGTESRFVGAQMDNLKHHFMSDSIAANAAGGANIKHVFEWPDRAGAVSDIPLFRLLKMGSGQSRYLTYEFLPSMRPVPLPPAIPADKRGMFAEHFFRQKALVMETMENVTIEPKNGKTLFIPAPDQMRGYIMTRKPVEVNPGGNSTGGFEKWWVEWFDTRAESLIQEKTKMAEEFISKTSQTIIRDVATGRFSSGSKVTFGYVEAAERNAELQMQMALDGEYEDE